VQSTILFGLFRAIGLELASVFIASVTPIRNNSERDELLEELMVVIPLGSIAKQRMCPQFRKLVSELVLSQKVGPKIFNLRVNKR
jgi:hypothetical protein